MTHLLLKRLPPCVGSRRGLCVHGGVDITGVERVSGSFLRISLPFLLVLMVFDGFTICLMYRLG